MVGRGVIVIAAAVAATFAAAALAQEPLQPRPPAHHPPAKRNAPSPPNDAISDGLSLEHECLNAVGATRRSPAMTGPGDHEAARAGAREHLDHAEDEARAGRGQACQDEVGSAARTLQDGSLPPR